jgi:hypothetical protein
MSSDQNWCYVKCYIKTLFTYIICLNLIHATKTNTKEAKRRHFHVKQTRSSKTASKEIREGKTYESEIGI